MRPLTLHSHYSAVFLFHFLPGATKKVEFGTRELPGANIHKPHRTGYREFALGGIKNDLAIDPGDVFIEVSPNFPKAIFSSNI